MDRVQIAAIVLAVAAFGLYYATLPGPRPEGERPPVSEAQARSDAERGVETEPKEEPAADRPVARSRHDAVISNDAVRLSVGSAGGRVQALELLDFPDRKRGEPRPVQLVTASERATLAVEFGDPLLRDLETGEWDVENPDARTVTLRAEAGGVEVDRRLSLDESGYGAWMRVQIRNRSEAVVRPRLQLVFYGRDRGVEAPDRLLNYSMVWSEDGGVGRTPIAGIGSPGFFGGLFGSSGNGDTRIEGPVEALGADCQYFLLAALSDNPRETQAVVAPLEANAGLASLQYGVMELPPGTSVERSWRLYLGPKIPEAVQAVDARFEPLTTVGWQWVQPLVHLFGSALKWLHGHVGNYGWAIIIITVLLRLATYPLTQRSMKSMRKFSAIAPEMKTLQEKYGDDRSKLQEEMMKLYREKGINPFSSLGGGCVPMLIQMPFMIALYFALQSSIELRHAPFIGWIDDLSAPEDWWHPFGFPLRVLPLAMGASMVLQQRLTPAPTADPQQRQMMTVMSLLFVVLFYSFPSGLLLYWFVSNLLGIGQQLLVNRPGPAAGVAVDNRKASA